MKDYTGQVFGRLIVKEYSHKIEYPKQTVLYWKCQCECGKEKVIASKHFTSNRTKSCGCLEKENLVKIGKENRTHGMSNTSIYKKWASMMGRANYIGENERRICYSDISVCKRWRKFDDFYQDMGEPPTSKHSIDRIDPFGNYEPDNCRWATVHEQMMNQRRNSEFYKNYQSLNAIVPYKIYRNRIKYRGWTVEKAAYTKKMVNQFR